jgi:hypothetical protein
VLYLYLREGLHRPKIEFDIKCNVVGKTEKYKIVEFRIIANNKGKIKFTFPELIFRLRGILDTDNLEYFENTKRLNYPELLFEENLISRKYKYYFIEAGIFQTISYVTKIPNKYEYILAFASFKSVTSG